jgi:hypothetical protein
MKNTKNTKKNRNISQEIIQRRSARLCQPLCCGPIQTAIQMIDKKTNLVDAYSQIQMYIALTPRLSLLCNNICYK